MTTVSKLLLLYSLLQVAFALVVIKCSSTTRFSVANIDADGVCGGGCGDPHMWVGLCDEGTPHMGVGLCDEDTPHMWIGELAGLLLPVGVVLIIWWLFLSGITPHIWGLWPVFWRFSLVLGL